MINDIVERVMSDYDFQIEDLQLEDDQLYLTVGYGNTEFDLSVAYDPASDTNDDFESNLKQALYDALDDYDLNEELMNAGLTKMQLLTLQQSQTTAANICDIKVELNNDLYDKHYSDIQNNIMEKLRDQAQSLIDDGYKIYPLMQAYVEEMYAVARCEPIYSRLDQILDQHDNTTHVFMYSANFFHFITATKNMPLIDQFNDNPHAVLDRIIRDNHLKVKNGAEYWCLTPAAYFI